MILFPLLAGLIGTVSNYLYLTHTSSLKNSLNRKERFGLAWFVLYSQINLIAALSLTLDFSPLGGFRGFWLFSLLHIVFRFFQARQSGDFSFYRSVVRANVSLVAKYSLVFVFIGFTVLMVQTQNTSRPQGFYTLQASLHTGKFAFIADLIRRCDQIPSIQTNFGQAILASSLGSGTVISSVLLLYLELSSSIFFFSIFVNGVMKRFLVLKSSEAFRFNSIYSSIPIIGSFSLSVAPVLLNDSGNPVIFTGYSDTIFGLFVLLFFFILLSDYQKGKRTPPFLMVAIILTTCYLSAPQSILFCSFAILVVAFGKLRSFTPFLRIYVFSLMLATLVWGGKTGMLLSSPEKASQNFPALGQVVTGNFLDIFKFENISPGIPYMVGQTFDSMKEIYPQGIMSAKLAVQDRADLFRFIWHVEQFGFTSIRIIFWSLFGVAFLIYMSRFKGHTILKGEASKDELFPLGTLARFTLSILTIGILLSTCFSLNSHKWEMSRFLYPGLVLGMFCLAICFARFDLLRRRPILHNALILTMLLPTFLQLTESTIHGFKEPSLVREVNTQFGTLGIFTNPLEMKCSEFLP